MADISFSEIVFPGAYSILISGISNSGQIAGTYYDPPTFGRITATHGFVESGRQLTIFDAPGASYTYVSGISDLGLIVGTYSASYDGLKYSYIKSGEQFITLNAPGAYATTVQGISASGEIFGTYVTLKDGTAVGHSFVEAGGQFTTLNAPGASYTSISGISALGEIFGSYNDSIGDHGFVEKEGQFIILNAPGAYHTYVKGISALGQVVGNYYDSTGSHGFIEYNGIFTNINGPDAYYTNIEGIGASGQIAGDYYDRTGSHGFIEIDGQFIVLNGPGAHLTSVDGISTSGQVFGSYIGSTGETRIFIASVDTTPPVMTPITLTLQVSEDQWVYHPDAQFVVIVDGQQVGGVHTVTALHSAGQTQDVTVTGDFSGAHKVDVEFLNDQYGGAGQDVNLYVHSLSLNGVVQNGSEATFDPTAAAQVGSTAQLYKNGSATFNLAPDTLAFRVSEDAWTYHPDAQFVVKVDGQQIGGVLTTHALHSAGAYDDISLKGNFADAHQVTVEFINDQYGGSGQDVNLYIDSISVNGQAIYGSEAVLDAFSGTHVGASAELFRNGSAVFNVEDLHHAGMLI